MPPRVGPASRTRREARIQRSSPPRFVWEPKEWDLKRTLNRKVELLESQTSKELIVKKVVRISANSVHDQRPLEIRILTRLPDSSRVVKPIFFSKFGPDPLHATIIFEHYRLGDLDQWVRQNYWGQNDQPVPESCIWRFFVQISQGLAFIQNKIGPQRERRQCLLTRDLKPENILVVDNGTAYPSFKLHDFDIAAWYDEENSSRPTRCGTFIWQPPENPIINTTAAEIWALGACVHYMAVGRPPVGDIEGLIDAFVEGAVARPMSADHYKDVEHYSLARVPRIVAPIHLSIEQQLQRGFWASKQQYSVELNDWMAECLSQSPDDRPTALRLLGPMTTLAKMRLKHIGGQDALVDLDIKFGPGT